MRKVVVFLLFFYFVTAQVFGELKPAKSKNPKEIIRISQDVKLTGILWSSGYKRAVFLVKEGYKILKEGEGDFKLKVIKIKETGVLVSIRGRKKFFSLRKKRKGGER